VNAIAIVDYGLCNLDSVRRAVEECGGHPIVTSRPQDVATAARIILPGVGAFPEAMENLRANGLDEALREQVVERGVPFLGICLGMQLMATRGFEGQITEGLGWIDADVRKLESAVGARVPHIGWNEVNLERRSSLFREVKDGSDFYFVHSYVMCPRNTSDVVGRTRHGSGAFAAAVVRDNMAGVQFHPEKSQRAGFAVIRNFLRDGAVSEDRT
jgi:glutamine amidotransferase